MPWRHDQRSALRAGAGTSGLATTSPSAALSRQYSTVQYSTLVQYLWVLYAILSSCTLQRVLYPPHHGHPHCSHQYGANAVSPNRNSHVSNTARSVRSCKARDPTPKHPATCRATAQGKTLADASADSGTVLYTRPKVPRAGRIFSTYSPYPNVSRSRMGMIRCRSHTCNNLRCMALHSSE